MLKLERKNVIRFQLKLIWWNNGWITVDEMAKNRQVNLGNASINKRQHLKKKISCSFLASGYSALTCVEKEISGFSTLSWRKSNVYDVCYLTQETRLLINCSSFPWKLYSHCNILTFAFAAKDVRIKMANSLACCKCRDN